MSQASSSIFTLNPEQRATFERDGLVRLDGLAPADKVSQAREVVLQRLAQIGLWRDGAWRLDALPRPAWPLSGLKATKIIGNRHPELAALFKTPALAGLVEAMLAGRRVDRRIYPRPQVLATLPNIDQWVLPNGWHTDAPRLASGRLPGVQLFTFLEPVAARGGATMAVAGSHRLLNDGRSLVAKRMRHELGREPYFRQLWRTQPLAWADDAELPSEAVANLPLRVVELTGEPGDVWLMDLRVFHSASPNAGARPRIMITNRYVAADVVREIAEAHGWATDDGAPPTANRQAADRG